SPARAARAVARLKAPAVQPFRSSAVALTSTPEAVFAVPPPRAIDQRRTSFVLAPITGALRTVIERVGALSRTRWRMTSERFAGGTAAGQTSWRSQNGNGVAPIGRPSGQRRSIANLISRAALVNFDGSRGGAGATHLRGATSASARFADLGAASQEARSRQAAARLYSEPAMTHPAAGRSREPGAIVINYSPSVTVNAGAAHDDIDSIVIEAMRLHGHELAQILARHDAVRRRTEF
ncbi:MAG TPA: hypothetical protein VJ718_11370, partial [Candidatus Binataceae bacterium]|nr:hypothetical protein [Candidatus Binataceae bacterium]